MDRLAVRSGLASLAAAMTLTAVAAHADDWPQFRRDAFRSGKSADPVKLPLTEVWSQLSKRKDGASPLYHSTIFKGRAYFTTLKDSGKFLVCADAKTGSVYWQQPLETPRLKFVISDVAGPAVTESGMVYVYDWITRRPTNSRAILGAQGQKSQSSGEIEALNSFAVKVFRAENGELLDFFPLAAMGANGVLPRLSLTHTIEGQQVAPVPPTFVGCPP
ncbi:MAG: hypothetical protein ACO1SX_11310 [Actinomycetota bacterium]